MGRKGVKLTFNWSYISDLERLALSGPSQVSSVQSGTAQSAQQSESDIALKDKENTALFGTDDKPFGRTNLKEGNSKKHAKHAELGRKSFSFHQKFY